MAGGEANREMACESEARRATTAARTEGAAASSPELAVAPRRRLAARQRLAVAVGVLSVALIAVSAAFLLPSAEQPALTGAAPAAPLPSGSSVSSQGEAGEADGAEPASDDAASSPDGGAASEGAASAAPFDAGADGASRAGGAGAHEGLPEPDPTPAPSGSGSSAAEPSTVTVSVGVSSSAVGDPVSGGTTVTFSSGATAYDALMACGLSVNAESGSGVYVTAIGGLAQKEHGGKSGWMYSVNGQVPMTACDNYVLHDGDDVQWFYVV